jgi:hypothetical protein
VARSPDSRAVAPRGRQAAAVGRGAAPLVRVRRRGRVRRGAVGRARGSARAPPPAGAVHMAPRGAPPRRGECEAAPTRAGADRAPLPAADAARDPRVRRHGGPALRRSRRRRAPAPRRLAGARGQPLRAPPRRAGHGDLRRHRLRRRRPAARVRDHAGLAPLRGPARRRARALQRRPRRRPRRRRRRRHRRAPPRVAARDEPRRRRAHRQPRAADRVRPPRARTRHARRPRPRHCHAPRDGDRHHRDPARQGYVRHRLPTCLVMLSRVNFHSVKHLSSSALDKRVLLLHTPTTPLWLVVGKNGDFPLLHSHFVSSRISFMVSGSYLQVVTL